MFFVVCNCLYTENPSCDWSDISKIPNNYDINTRLGKFNETWPLIGIKWPFNETNATMLEAGDIVELKCADSIPPRRPIVDQEDDDELDGIVRMFCMSPTTPGQLGR